MRSLLLGILENGFFAFFPPFWSPRYLVGQLVLPRCRVHFRVINIAISIFVLHLHVFCGERALQTVFFSAARAFLFARFFNGGKQVIR